MERNPETQPSPAPQPSATKATATEPGARFEIHTVTSVADLLERLRTEGTDDKIQWYRGHSNADYQLLPSLARDPCDVSAERTLIKRFKQNAYPFLEAPPTTPWDWLFLMQHYEAPTRLLDWSDSTLTALWFAVSKVEEEPRDGCVWALNPIDLNTEARLIPAFPLDIPLFGQDPELDNYLPEHLDTMRTNTPAAGIASRQFTRVVAQMGSFTVTGKEQIALEDLDTRCLTKYLIPADAKDTFRKELTALRITRLSIFPELSNVAEVAQEGLWTVSG